MKKKSLFILTQWLFLFFFLLSCNTEPQWENGQEQDGLKTSILKDKEGRLYGKKIFRNEAKTNYTYLQFDSKGNLVDSITFLNNKREGLRIFLLDDKVYYETYKNGIMNGLQQVLYSNGVAEFVGNLKNGIKVGEWKFFYEDSSPITYEFYDNKGKLVYFIKYEKDGRIKERKGSEIIDFHMDKKEIPFSDTLTVAILLAFPPNSENNLLVLKASNSEESVEIPVSEPETFFQIVANKKGEANYTLDYHWNIKDQEEVYSAKTAFNLNIK